MKRFLSFAALVIFIMTGCNSQPADKPAETDEKKDVIEDNGTDVAVSNEPIHLTKKMFLEEIMDYESNPEVWVYKGELPGLVDFYADWCRPCRITSPILAELAKEYEGQIKVYKVNVDKEKELAAVFGVQSIPAFLFIPKDKDPVMSAGIAQTPEETKSMFKKQIEQILLNKGE